MAIKINDLAQRVHVSKILHHGCGIKHFTYRLINLFYKRFPIFKPGRVAQSVGHLIHKSELLGSIPGLATYFRFSFR